MAADWYPPHQPNCMGCGPENPASLGIRMRADRDGEGVVGEVTFSRAHEGAPGFAHGGAVAAALDDAIGMLIFRLRRPAVTRRLEVDYVAPCFVGHRYDITAVCERAEGRKLWMVASLLEEDRVVAGARGLFVTVDAQHFLQGDANRQLPW